MCKTCDDEVARRFGQEPPDLDEFLDSVIQRAEVTLDLFNESEGNEPLGKDAHRFAGAVYGCFIQAFGERMSEEWLTVAPAWVTKLGQQRYHELLASDREGAVPAGFYPHMLSRLAERAARHGETS